MKEERDPVRFRIRGHAIRLSWPKAIFLLGALILALLIAETAVVWFLAPDLFWPILRGVAAEITTGREGGIPVYLEGGVPPLLTIQYGVSQDIMAAFLAYPLFLYLLDRYHDRENFVMRRIRKIEASAENHEQKVRRYGPVFLFLFLLVPFILNGPLVGLIIGRVARVPMRTLLLIVPAATITGATAWTYFYDTLFAWASSILPGSTTYITIAIVVLIVLFFVIGFIIEQVREKRGKGDEKGKNTSKRGSAKGEE